MNIYRTSAYEDLKRTARQAAEWLQIMKANPSSEDNEAFTAWMTASPLHVKEWLLISMLDRELTEPAALRKFDVDAAIAKASLSGNVVSLTSLPVPDARLRARRGIHAQPSSSWLLRYAAASFAVVVLSAGALSLVRSQLASSIEYATAIGEQRSIKLSDGSVLTLDPRSRISVDFSGDVRDVRLHDGEADFAVAHDASRPFRVHAGASTIQAVGTQFSVNRRPSGTLVSVTEGKVQVFATRYPTLDDGISAWLSSFLPDGQAEATPSGKKIESLKEPANLSAGEAARISASGNVMARSTLEPETETASAMNPPPAQRMPRLSFREDTLADIADEFNRYNTVQIKVDGAAARTQRFGGVFSANDPESFLQFIECCSSLAVARNGEQIRIKERSTVTRRD
jgi:transmembrane sensor